MALPFNPFDKPRAAKASSAGKQYTKVKVFERADFETQSSSSENITEQNKTQQNNTKQDKDNFPSNSLKSASGALSPSQETTSGDKVGQDQFPTHVSREPKLEQVSDQFARPSLEINSSDHIALPTRDCEINLTSAGEKVQNRQTRTEQNKTKLNKIKPDKTKQNTAEQNQTDLNKYISLNPTKLNTTLNKNLNNSEQNKTEQNKTGTRLDELILALTGNRKRLVQAIYEICLQNNVSEFETNYRVLADLSDINVNSIKTTSRLLSQSGYFVIRAPRGGRGAQIVVSVETNLLLIFSKYQTQLNKKLHNTLNKTSPSKLVSNLDKNLLTTDDVAEPEIVLSDEVKRLGISQKHLKDIRNQKLQVNFIDLQNFVTKFSVYVSDLNNVRGVKSFPALFISMVQSLSRGEDPLAGVETPEEQLVQKLLSERKAHAEKRKAAEQELENFEFESWFEKLTDASKLELVPESNIVKPGTYAQKMLLKEHFKTNVWESVRKALFSQLNS